MALVFIVALYGLTLFFLVGLAVRGAGGCRVPWLVLRTLASARVWVKVLNTLDGSSRRAAEEMFGTIMPVDAVGWKAAAGGQKFWGRGS